MNAKLRKVFASNLHITKKLEAVIGARNIELRACKIKINRLQRCFDAAMEIIATHSEWRKLIEQDELAKTKARSAKRHSKARATERGRG